MKAPILLTGALLAANSAHAEGEAKSAADALAGGRANLSFRLRYEGADDAGLARQATAATLRSRVTWQSAACRGFRALVEIDDVRAPVEDYNSTANGRTSWPTVADPTGTDLNRAVLEWQSGTTQIAAGRQRINLDNQRFIGGSGWRQNEQTFDGVTARARIAKRLDLTYGYLYQINRVYGPDNGTQAAEWHGQVHLFRAHFDAKTAGQVTAFSYLMDFHNAAAQSTTTTGLLWTGSPSLGGSWSLPLSLSYARQTDHGAAATPYSAHYLQAEIAISRAAWTLKAGREILSGDPTVVGRRFQTPLASLHAYQGWADKFLITPPRGIDDTYIGISGKVRKVALQASWHDFSADAIHQRYGREWDVLASVPFGGRYEAMLKFADYRAATFSMDTRKAWFMFSASL
jgi:hypothetical protein